MAPRRRPTSTGLTRMDAAIDALTPMGYTEKFVRSKVNELLEVYGLEGWRFIEEGSYSTLIEYILKEAEGPQELGECSSQPLAVKNGDHVPMEAQDMTENGDHVPVESQNMEAGPSHEALDLSLCSPKDAALLSPVTVLSPRGFENFCSTPGEAISRRNCCLGWIGDKKDEDYVLLEKALVQSWKVGDRGRKRKSRWDVGPEDI